MCLVSAMHVTAGIWVNDEDKRVVVKALGE